MNPDPASLDRLHDVVAPAPLPWWPPAPGWCWVLGALAVAFLFFAVRFFLQWQRDRYRREALLEWRRHEVLLHHPDSRADGLAGMAELLKRAAVSAWPRERVASLTGARWLAFLDETGGTTGFSSGSGALLENAAYDPRGVSALDDSRVRAAAELARDWLKNHRAGGGA